jgi:hypothetical protein
MQLPSSEFSSEDPLCYFAELDPYPDYYFKADPGPDTDQQPLAEWYFTNPY